MPPQPIREGADRAEVSVTMDDGVVIKRTVTRKDDGWLLTGVVLLSFTRPCPRTP